MPLQKLEFRPGVNREGTSYSAEGGWYDCDKIRFRSGLKICMAGKLPPGSTGSGWVPRPQTSGFLQVSKLLSEHCRV